MIDYNFPNRWVAVRRGRHDGPGKYVVAKNPTVSHATSEFRHNNKKTARQNSLRHVAT
jgi:hypothetical protein